jgi:hypothetical protein
MRTRSCRRTTYGLIGKLEKTAAGSQQLCLDPYGCQVISVSLFVCLACSLVWQCLLVYCAVGYVCTLVTTAVLPQIGEEWTKTCSSCGHVNHHVGAHCVFCCPYCGQVADRDAQAAKNILGHGLSVLRDSNPGLYKTCVDGTRLAVSALGVVSPGRTVAVA